MVASVSAGRCEHGFTGRLCVVPGCHQSELARKKRVRRRRRKPWTTGPMRPGPLAHFCTFVSARPERSVGDEFARQREIFRATRQQ